MVQILSIGELIHTYRHKQGMALSQLTKLTGIHKATISKIENGEVRRPEYATIQPLARALNVPLKEFIELYVTVERRAEPLLRVLEDVLQQGENAALVRPVGAAFLASTSYDSYTLVEQLYDFTATVELKTMRLTLYQLIVDYSRDHGIMPFLARGLYQVYLIERDDFTRLRNVYESGKHIVQYANFLGIEDRITLYYKLAVHAFNLFLYRKSINLCLHVLQEADADNWYYINALGILQDSYFYIEDYDKSEYYSHLYTQYDYPHIKANSVLMGALLNAKKGNSAVAVEQLTSFLETCNQNDALHAINQLMLLYLKDNLLDKVEQLLAYPICPKSISTNNPNIISQLAEYYYHRAEYFIAIGDLDQGISDFLESALYYSKVNDIVRENECLNQNKINELRQKLISLANTKETLTDDEVVQISKQLDIYILEFQKRNLKKRIV